MKLISPQYTSQTCSSCGYRAKENRTSQADFSCVKCSFSENADLNVALTILVVETTVSACGEIKLVAT